MSSLFAAWLRPLTPRPPLPLRRPPAFGALRCPPWPRPLTTETHHTTTATSPSSGGDGSSRKKRHGRRRKGPSAAQRALRIRQQLEFYLSDYALVGASRRSPASWPDETARATLPEYGGGGAALASLVGYPRLQQMGVGVEEAAAVLESSTLLRLSRCSERVRRRYELGEQGRDFIPLTDEEAGVFEALASFKAARDGAGLELAFPPGDDRQRAVVHAIAHILGLKHLSVGRGARNQNGRSVVVSRPQPEPEPELELEPEEGQEGQEGQAQ